MKPFTFFISYRRETAPIALLLKYEIEKRLQFVRVIVDVTELRAGERFPDGLRRFIEASHATIVLIADNWMPDGVSNRSSDWVVQEIAHSRHAPLVASTEQLPTVKERFILPLFVNRNKRFSDFDVPEDISFLTELQSEAIDYASWPLSIGPLLDRIAVLLDLKKRPDADEYPVPNKAKARTQRLPDEEISKALLYDDYGGWYVDNFGDAEARYLVKIFKFKGFRQATEFMALVTEYCKIQKHHPEWRNVYNQVTVALTTWDAHRRITLYDLGLALFMNQAAKKVSRPQ